MLREASVLTPLPQKDKELIFSFKKSNYESFQSNPIIKLAEQIICNEELKKARGDIHHVLAV